MTESRVFRCEPEAVTAVRRYVRDALTGQPPRLIEAAELMASELATNCVRHAGTDFELAIDTGNEIRVEVHDVHPGRPTVRSPAPAEPSGRGLRIVQALADAWGVTPSPDGKIVWFALYLPDESGYAATAAARSRPGARDARRVRRRAGSELRGRGGPRAGAHQGLHLTRRATITLHA